eukprot:NODE_666_length_1418_cov_623.880411.p8 GENE.NODE_666_length_1418_cov_623.880411~~NODE_666_length_1418_cov_623.880411.p8  ORF type:complete len:63 (-),score=6.90 NODE_666_length_1418_cov_623.880411:912-1100(-)
MRQLTHSLGQELHDSCTGLSYIPILKEELEDTVHQEFEDGYAMRRSSSDAGCGTRSPSARPF